MNDTDDMPLSLERPALEPLFAELATLADPLARAAFARRALGPALGRRAAELVALRDRARERFPDGAFRHLTAKGLEQASRPAVAAWRAARLREALGAAPALDPTCGLGSDALALARAGFDVRLGDRAAAPLRAARAHLAEAGHPAHGAAQVDARALPWRAAFLAECALVLDPDRRPEGAREADPSAWSPSLDACLALTRGAAAGCIKAAPIVDPARLRLAAGAVEASWISHRGELVEVALWTGAAARRGSAREAVVLRADGAEVRAVRASESAPVEVTPLTPSTAAGVAWFVEPDPAVIRAGLIEQVARDAGLAPLAPRIAYLGGDAPGPPGLTRSWPVLAGATLDRKRLRRVLGALDIGPLTVKKRGHPDTADVLARRYAGPGSRPGLIAVLRLAAGHLALVLGPEHDPASTVLPGEDGGR